MQVEDLIGLKLTLRLKQVEYMGESYPYYSIADTAMAAKINALAPEVRIIPPNTKLIGNHNPKRLNIYVNDNFKVFKIKYE